MGDGVSALKGALQRAELLNVLVRLALQWARRDQKFDSLLGPRLQTFLKLYVDPVVEKSHITEHRGLIRSSKRLNELLYMNQPALKKVFEGAPRELDGSRGFTLRAAGSLFLPPKKDTLFPLMSAHLIDECFVAS